MPIIDIDNGKGKGKGKCYDELLINKIPSTSRSLWTMSVMFNFIAQCSAVALKSPLVLTLMVGAFKSIKANSFCFSRRATNNIK